MSHPGPPGPYPPLGTPCAYCGQNPALPHPQFAGKAQLYCSTRCRKAEHRRRYGQRWYGWYRDETTP